jgi:hypothetical protein
MTPQKNQPMTTLPRLAFVVATALLAGERCASAVEYQSYFQTDPCAEQRAGHPQRVKAIAAPTNTRHYGGYYVGGGNIGAAGGPRTLEQGTWGWDYGGLFKNNWVRLGWNCGNRPQGGTGAYKTDFAPRQH